MKKFLGLGVLIFIGFAGWRIGENLSSDATSMAIGILFGVMAGIPTALLVLASDRRRESDERLNAMRRQSQLPIQPHPYVQQPPVIVVTGQAPPSQAHPTSMSGYEQGHGHSFQNQIATGWQVENPQRKERSFTVIGGNEEWQDEGVVRG